MYKKYLILIFAFIFVSCASKVPVKTSSATVVFKTPSMKFYDKGFINKYDDFIELNILNLGKSVLYLKIYKDEVCQSAFKCMSSKEFNSNYLNASYEDDFLYRLFSNKIVYHKDKINNILIKVRYD